MVTRVEVPQVPADAPEGHDEEMAKLGAAAVDGVDAGDAAPDVPDNAAGLEIPTPEPTKADEPNSTPAEPDAADEALKGTGLELTAFETEFAETGALSPESYEKLSKAGIPKAMVDQYIAGQQAMATQYQAEAHAQVGGAESYTAMVGWAAANLSDADKAAFNNAVDQGGSNAKLAIAGLNAQFKAAQGTNPTLLNGFAPSGASDVSGFRSTAELTTAMRDPRYAKDSAYRKDVEARLAASQLF